jgi:hypothetical protein
MAMTSAQLDSDDPSVPKRRAETRICVAVSQSGVKVYGNREAFQSLAEWMRRLAHSPAKEYYECHLTWHLEAEESFFRQNDKNVWVLFDSAARQFFAQATSPEHAFDLDFMAVEAEDLDRLQPLQATGLLPDDWNKE